MKNNIAIIAVILLTLSSCTTEQVKDMDALEHEISVKAESLASGGNLRILETRDSSGKGYYYIIKKSGIITYHPGKGLIGSDFSRFGFVRKILKEKNGCIRSEGGGVSRLIIFRDKGEGEILCFTIPDSEITGSHRCEKYTD